MQPTDPTPVRAPFRRLLGLGLAALGVLAAIAVTAALMGSGAASAAPWLGLSAHRRGAEGDLDRMLRHVRFATEHALNEIDATAEQRERIQAIVAQEVEALHALHAERGEVTRGPGGHAAWLELLGAETIDREAVEALRREHLAMADAASARLADALVEIAEVLTHEQRLELLARAEDHRGHRMHGRPRWH
jgi:Spy/CpxP family protein refolding chaperone